MDEDFDIFSKLDEFGAEEVANKVEEFESLNETDASDSEICGFEVAKKKSPKKKKGQASKEEPSILKGKDKTNKSRSKKRPPSKKKSGNVEGTDEVIVEKDSCQPTTSSQSLNNSLPVQQDTIDIENVETRPRTRRQRRGQTAACNGPVECIDLVSPVIPVVTGFISLDSDDEHNVSNKDSQVNNLDSSFDLDNPEITVKINWNAQILIFNMRKYEKFQSIFEELAKKNNVPVRNVVLNLDQRILHSDDSPDSINYKVYQFISGRAVEKQSSFQKPDIAKVSTNDSDKISVKVQCEQIKNFVIEILKTDKFKILYIKCAEKLNQHASKLKLSFDGDILDANESPEDLDFEGGEVIDLAIKN